jgi:DNA polymerase III epsilon subunit family exonuclease
MEAPFIVLMVIAIIAILGFVWMQKKSGSEGEESNQTVSFRDPSAGRSIPSSVTQDRCLQVTTQPVPSPNSAGDEITPSGVGQGEHKAPELRSQDSLFLPQQFVFLDLETTGLSPEMDEIIEIGAIRLNRSQINQATFSTLVKPEKRIPRLITEINGITQGMVNEGGVPSADALSGFIEFIGDLPLVTFNADFDMGFLWNAAKRQGLAIENRYACALKLARRAWPGLPSYRLADLAKIGNLSDDDTHRALGDCKRAVIIFASAVSQIGEEIRWSYRQRDWREYVKYHAARDPNRAFVSATRPLEVSDPAQAVIRYNEAMGRMYDYETLIGGRSGDDQILDRLTLCLWRLGRYQELIDSVEGFIGRFPEAKSSLMTGILRRREKAARKVLPIDRVVN